MILGGTEMSHHTKCNYCTLKKMKKDAKQKGQKLVLKQDADGWTTVTVDGEFHTSFMKLTDHCVC